MAPAERASDQLRVVVVVGGWLAPRRRVVVVGGEGTALASSTTMALTMSAAVLRTCRAASLTATRCEGLMRLCTLAFRHAGPWPEEGGVFVCV